MLGWESGPIALALDLSEAHVLLVMMAIGAAVEAPVLKNPLGIATIVFATLNTQAEVGIGSLLPPVVLACITSWALLDQVHYFPAEKQQVASGHTQRESYGEAFESLRDLGRVHLSHTSAQLSRATNQSFSDDLSVPLNSEVELQAIATSHP